MADETLCPDPATLLRLELGQIPEPRATELRGHVAQCPRCSLGQPLQKADTPNDAVAGPDPTPAPLPAPLPALPDVWDSDAATAKVPNVSAPPPQVDPQSMEDVGPSIRLMLRPPEGPNELGRLGGYRVLRVLGRGGMGLIFEAEDLQLSRRVALKVIRPEQAETGRARDRFLREARAVAKLTHDHIVTIHQVGEDNNVLFLAMQLLQGEPLSDRLRREGRLPVAEALRIGRQIAEALVAAHHHGLIHRDIKPANVYLERLHGKAPSRVKVLDFGLARVVDGGGNPVLTQAGIVIGTPGYMAPEQAQCLPLDARCDLFSLGCVLHRMVSGEDPFKGDTPLNLLVALTVDPVPLLTDLRPETPYSLAALVQHLLAKASDGRPASAEVVMERLAGIEEELANVRAPAPERSKAASVLVPPPVERPRAPTPVPLPLKPDWKSLANPPKSAPALPPLPPLPPPPPTQSLADRKTLADLGRPAPPLPPPPAPASTGSRPTVDLPSPSVLAEASVCPTCDGEFQLLNGQRWCLRCGYCVDTELAPKVEEEPKPPPPTVPEWLNFLGAGCVLIGTATVALGLLLSPGSVLLMVWIGVQAALGILGYFVGHLRLVGGTAVDENESKEPLAMNPVAVWRRAIHDLPQTLWPLCCAGWGVTALVCAIVLALVKY